MRFKCFSSTWQHCLLNDCVIFLDEQRKPIKETDRKKIKGEYPYYGASGIIDNINSYIFDDDLILLSEDGANILDRNYRVSFIVRGKIWVNNHAHVLKPKNKIDINYLSEYLENLDYAKYNTGSAQPKLNQDVCKNITINIPDYNEQQKIGKFLSIINQRIDTQSKIIEDLELFEKEINNTIINKLVEHKDLVKFSSLYNFAKEGGTPNTSHFEYYTKGSIPFVKIDDLTTKYLVSNQSFITKLGLENSSAWLIPANSILYSNGATIGAISINKYPVTTKQGILGIVPKSDYLSEYLYYFLRSNYFKKEICKITTQGTMKSVYIKDIDNILVPHLNKNQQNEILTLLSEITLKIQKEKDMLELYKKQKAYLLKNMFI